MMRIFFSVVMELIFLQRRKKQLAVKGRISSWVTLKFPLLKKFLRFLFRLVSTSWFFSFHSFVAGATVAAQWSSKRLVIKGQWVRILPQWCWLSMASGQGLSPLFQVMSILTSLVRKWLQKLKMLFGVIRRRSERSFFTESAVKPFD